MVGYLAVTTVYQYRQQATARHQAMLDAGQPDSGTMQPDAASPSGGPASEVLVGTYVNRIVDLSVQNDK